MLNREEFVALACAQGMLAKGSSGERQDYADHLVQTANAVADRLGLGAVGRSGREAELEELVRVRDVQLADTMTSREALLARVKELEQALDQATMPAPKKKAGGQ